jgi:acyl transferase domain-containing protein
MLPGIAFERQRHWLEPSVRPAASAAIAAVTTDQPRLYAPVWRRWLAASGELPSGPYLVVQGGPVGRAVSAALKAAGRTVVETEAGTDHGQVLATLREKGIEPSEIVHTLAVDADDDSLLDQSFHAVHALVRALIGSGCSGTLTVASRGAYAVTGSETVRPEAATLRGLVQVAPQEHPGLRCRGLDVAPRADEDSSAVASTIVAGLGLGLEQPIVAHRGRQLWVPDHQELPRPPDSAGLLRHGGVYLITGGTGAIGPPSPNTSPENTTRRSLSSREEACRRTDSWLARPMSRTKLPWMPSWQRSKKNSGR